MSGLDPRNIAVVWDTPEVATALDEQRAPTRKTPKQPPANEGRRPGGGRG